MRLAIWVAMLVMLPHAASAQAPTYTATFLGPANHVEAMNESGHVVGWVTSGATRAFVAGPGRPYLLLPLPAGMVSSIAHDINEAGVIVGAVGPSYVPDYYLQARAARWTPNGVGGYTVNLLGTLPGHVSSGATAANDVGDIVGYSSNGTFRLPVLFTPTGPVDLSATGIFDPADVNNQRIVVDHSAFLLRLDLDTMVVENAGIPPGSYRSVWMQTISDSGTAVGAAILTTGTSCDRQAALHDGTSWQILSPCGSINSAYDVNALDDVLMQLNLAVWVRLVGIGTFRVEDLISTDGGQWFVISSYDNALNDARQIAVLATNDDTGQSGAVLLTPEVSRPACDDGIDNDGDGRIDHPADPACKDATWIREQAQCQDGLDNDDDGRIDIDGGASFDLDHDGFIDAQFDPATPAVGARDGQCSAAFENMEAASCGLGAELLALVAMVRRMKRASIAST